MVINISKLHANPHLDISHFCFFKNWDMNEDKKNEKKRETKRNMESLSFSSIKMYIIMKQKSKKSIEYIQFSIFVLLIKDNDRTMIEITIDSISKENTTQPISSLENEQKPFIINNNEKTRKYLFEFLLACVVFINRVC
jgi:hypothetical protein